MIEKLRGRWWLMVVVLIMSMLLFSMTAQAANRTLKYGMVGQDVKVVQQDLQKLGYYQGKLDGIFGSQTKRAVINFQRSNRLAVDGIVGLQTRGALQNAIQNKVLSSRSGSRRFGELMSWQDVNKMIPVGKDVLVTDVVTQKSYTARRFGGNLHADMEPLTAKDAAIMKQIYGGQWSWSRRAVIVTVNGRRIAASQNGMPHTNLYNIKNNNFAGHYCIHFYHSKKHYDGLEDPEHQATVRRAAGY